MHYYRYFFKETLKRFRGNKIYLANSREVRRWHSQDANPSLLISKTPNTSIITQWHMAMSGSYHAIPPVERVAAGKDTAHVKAHSGDKSKGKL